MMLMRFQVIGILTTLIIDWHRLQHLIVINAIIIAIVTVAVRRGIVSFLTAGKEKHEKNICNSAFTVFMHVGL